MLMKAKKVLDQNLDRNKEQKELFEKFHDCWSEYISLSEAAIFEYAFKLGANLMLNAVKD